MKFSVASLLESCSVPPLLTFFKKQKLIKALNEIKSNDDYDDIMTIFARREWDEDFETIIVPQTEDQRWLPPLGMS